MRQEKIFLCIATTHTVSAVLDNTLNFPLVHSARCRRHPAGQPIGELPPPRQRMAANSRQVQCQIQSCRVESCSQYYLHNVALLSTYVYETIKIHETHRVPSSRLQQRRLVPGPGRC